MQAQEEWRAVEYGYAVSSLGRVQGKSGKILKPRVHTHGYHRISMCNGDSRVDQYVHRLVCLAFHGEPPVWANQVDHINKRRDDNRAENLRWVSKAENLAHRQHPRGSSRGNAKLHEDDVRQIKGKQLANLSNREVAQRFGVARETIRDIRCGKQWRHISA